MAWNTIGQLGNAFGQLAAAPAYADYSNVLNSFGYEVLPVRVTMEVPMHGHSAPDFGRVSPEHAATFVGIMSMLHTEPAAPAFARLLKKQLQPDDYVLLAHLFEEISVLALHHLIPEALLFDAFAFDLYWDELREDIMSLRQQTGNEKFCENFEIASDRARDYRNDRPPKRRWHRKPGEDPPGPRGGHRPPGPEGDPGQRARVRQEPAIRRRA